MTDPARRPQPPDVPLVRETAVEPPAFRAIYDAEFGYVWRSLRRLGGRAADLEDLAHDVFVVVHRKLGDYDPNRPLKPWLFGIAFRVVSDYRRRARFAAEVATGDVEAADGALRADAQLEVDEQRALVIDALETIDLDRRAVLVLHDIDGQTAPAIAEALDVPVNTVYSRLRVARERFAAAVRRLRARRGDP